ncbi:hypothetical protein, partial [Actinomyces wuliandei]|uniref:hypothetical protein n=1 Tax=Actinomyces wuliandei TaxID=2057743 RepID=UPI001C569DF8
MAVLRGGVLWAATLVYPSRVGVERGWWSWLRRAKARKINADDTWSGPLADDKADAVREGVQGLA